MARYLRRGYREVLEEFLNVYKSEPCLWHVKSQDYHNKKKKKAAYRKLVEIYKEIEPNADHEAVVRKINSIRTSYRKERKKVDQSRQLGTDSVDIHVPTLWYYHLLDFLNDQDATISSISDLHESIDMKDPLIGDYQIEDVDPVEQFETIQTVPIETPNFNTNSTHLQVFACTSEKSVPYKRTVPENCDSVLESTNELKKPKIKLDRHAVFGKIVSMKLRDVTNNTQRLLAEKLINEALFLAEMGQLTLSHRIDGP